MTKMIEKKINPVSDYPECADCSKYGTDDCPALYRITEHCPFK